MLARVYDSSTDTYFKSEVYAKINMGWYEKQLVRVPCNKGDYLRLYDYLDKDKSPAKVLINTITPEYPADWIVQKSGSVDEKLSDYAHLLNDNVRFFEYIGFSWLIDDKSTMIKLLNGDSIPVCGSIFENKSLNNYESGWNYIETQNDTDQLMEKAAAFHDSILVSLNYISGGYVGSDRSMCPVDAVRKVALIINSQISDPIEMVFEGVTALNLRPASDNQTANIFEASLFIKDCTVFFCDDSVPVFDTSYTGTWITSYSMRWRFI